MRKARVTRVSPVRAAVVLRAPLTIVAVTGLLVLSSPPQRAVAQAPAPIEDELVVQTPVSAFIVEAMLKEFSVYAKDRWNVTLRTRAHRAGTPVSYERIVNWKGQPEADIFWGGEPALFNSLAAQKHGSAESRPIGTEIVRVLAPCTPG